MTAKKSRAALALAWLLPVCAAAPLGSQINQMNRIAYFRGVPIQADLQFKKAVLPQGKYDLEFMRVPNTKAYYLRIMRKGKILHLVQGENYPYTDKSQVCIAPRLCMNRDAEANALEIVVESGAYTRPYSGIRARYVIACAGAEPAEPVQTSPPAETEPAEPTREEEDPGRR